MNQLVIFQFELAFLICTCVSWLILCFEGACGRTVSQAFFPSMDDLRHVLIEEFIKTDREFRFVFNYKNKLRAEYKGIGCHWVLYAKVKGPNSSTVRVNTLVYTQ